MPAHIGPSHYTLTIGGWDGPDGYEVAIGISVDHLDDALKLARHWKQQAIWDMEEGVAIDVDPAPVQRLVKREMWEYTSLPYQLNPAPDGMIDVHTPQPIVRRDEEVCDEAEAHARFKEAGTWQMYNDVYGNSYPVFIVKVRLEPVK
jgi:hypothetical protein